jgi:hypothetical protein
MKPRGMKSSKGSGVPPASTSSQALIKDLIAKHSGGGEADQAVAPSNARTTAPVSGGGDVRDDMMGRAAEKGDGSSSQGARRLHQKPLGMSLDTLGDEMFKRSFDTPQTTSKEIGTVMDLGPSPRPGPAPSESPRRPSEPLPGSSVQQDATAHTSIVPSDRGMAKMEMVWPGLKAHLTRASPGQGPGVLVRRVGRQR